MSREQGFWGQWQLSIRSFAGALQVIHKIHHQWVETGRSFAWRGQRDARWPLHSSLYRKLLDRSPTRQVSEPDLARKEMAILKEVKQWGLHSGRLGRKSVLAQLALLQHYGTPTRMIDITFNPLIAFWFAVQRERKGGQRLPDTDGRVFAIDVSRRLINDRSKHGEWEDSTSVPWPTAPNQKSKSANKRISTLSWHDWQSRVLAWRPPTYDSRIAAQDGGFLLGGVPFSGSHTKPVQWRKGPKTRRLWKIGEVREATSVALSPNILKTRTGRGQPPLNPVYTIRIHASAKQAIRESLRLLYGYDHSSLFPDYPGFSDYGTPEFND